MMKKLLFTLFALTSVLSFSQETINTMFYNLFRFPSSNPANREFILRDILDEYQPDLFMVCELETEVGADLILNTSLQNLPNFQRAVYHKNTSSTSDFIQNMVYFNTEKLELISQEIHPTNYRDIDQYSFRLNTQEAETEPIYLEVFVTHLKSSTGTANQQARLAMVEVFTQALEDLNPNSYVLFAGDFNLYTSSEPAYQKILSLENAIQMVDPINTPGSWNNNANFKHVHTQSTRLSNSGFGSGANAGASGGMDDRFDFIMMSNNFNTSSDFYYVEDTYKAYGNNGNCFDKSINSEDCSGEYSFELRDDLYWMSDHTPVVMQFETTQTFLSTPVYVQKPMMWFNSPNYGSSYIELGINQQQLNSEAKNIYIYNLLGQKVRSITIGEQENILLDISGLSNGIYLIKTDSNTEVLKFIKQ
jgi:endonuclease/exonuclease/phosphatase family metal-dependent hydrolase